MPKKKTEVAVVELKNQKPSTDSMALVSPDQLRNQIEIETEKRKLITAFIGDHLKQGTDFGKIHVFKSCPNHKTPWNCTNDYHFSKNTLFKPGAEKFGSLFKMRGAYKRDNDTWEMLGSPAGTVCYICELFTARDVLLGEGRGAASVAEKGNPNTAIKIAKKRAFVDAILATGALSDFFTQDLEDMKDLEPEAEDVPVITTHEHKPMAVPQMAIPKISDKTKILHLCKLLDIPIDPFTEDEIKKHTGLDVKEESNYKEIISRLEMLVKERKEAGK